MSTKGGARPVPLRRGEVIDAPTIRALVREELRGILASLIADERNEPAAYSSRAGHGPPGYGARRWRRVASEIGTRRGRWFVVTRDQLAAYERGQVAAKPVAASEPPTSWDPETAFRSVGLRCAR